MSDQATDEEVAEIKQILSFGGLDLGISNKAVAKLLARLEAVERERDRWKKLESEAAECVEMVIIHRSRYFTGEEPYVGWKGLGLALRQDFDERDRLREALREVQPWFEGEHAFDHPSCVIIRKALEEG